MRAHPTAALAALLLLVTTTLAPLALAEEPESAPDPPVILSALLPNPDAEQAQVEFIELWNRGDMAVQLQGWTIKDYSNPAFTFPSWTLSPGARVVVWSGSGATATPEGPLRSTSFWWRAAGDTATLRDPGGAIVDWLAYGDRRDVAPPPGFDNSTMPAAPPKGTALLWTQEGWVQGEATPGRSPGEEGGAATFEVLDVPPRITILDVPQRLRAGAEASLTFRIEEDNGDAVTWRLDGPGGVLATGSGVGDQIVALTAPLATGPWPLVLNASDTGGNHAVADIFIELVDRDLLVSLPPAGAVRFPGLVPGDRNVTSLEPFVIENTGTASHLPRIDLSPFRSGNAEVSVDGNLRIGIRLVGSVEEPVWTDYQGPYTALPSIGAGTQFEVHLRIVEVPLPLPAGNYGTSFTITEATP